MRGKLVFFKETWI